MTPQFGNQGNLDLNEAPSTGMDLNKMTIVAEVRSLESSNGSINSLQQTLLDKSAVDQLAFHIATIAKGNTF